MTSKRHMRLALTSSLAVIGLLAGGCANQTTAYRTQRLGDSPMVITTDAYQRHLLVVPGPDGRGIWRTCAEASPDVFSAISGSGAGDLGFNSSGPGTEAQARAAMSIAQSAATAERTQTINLLRESMFRTCERYVNGGIDRATLVVQAGRDWRAMIAILAIEQLTATGRPASTIVSAGGTSADVMGGAEARRQLDEAKENQSAAKRRLEEAEARTCEAAGAGAAGSGAGAGSGSNGNSGAGGGGGGGSSGANGDSGAVGGGATGGNADSNSGSDDGADDDTETGSGAAEDNSSGGDSNAGSSGSASGQTPQAAEEEEEEEEGPDCATEKETEVNSAKAAVAEADAEVASAQRQVDQIARSGAGTTPGTVSAVGHARSLTPAALRIVAPIVERIVMEAFDTDETQLLCLQILYGNDHRVEPQSQEQRDEMEPVQSRCLVYLMERIDRDTAGLWNSPEVLANARPRSIQIDEARLRLLQFLRPLSPEAYAQARATLSQRLHGFCEGASKEQCIQRVREGEVSDVRSRAQVLLFIEEQRQARRQ